MIHQKKELGIPILSYSPTTSSDACSSINSNPRRQKRTNRQFPNLTQKPSNFRSIAETHFDVIAPDDCCLQGAVFSSQGGFFQVLNRVGDSTSKRRLNTLCLSVLNTPLARQSCHQYKVSLKIPFHPHIAQYRSFFCTSSHQFILSKYCAGGTARTRLDATTYGLEPIIALRLIYETLSALTHAHEHGISHMNLSLESIGLTIDGSVRVRGFWNRCTQNYENRCIEYLAPELMAMKEYKSMQISHEMATKADAWATGIILLLLLNRVTQRSRLVRFVEVQHAGMERSVTVVSGRAMITCHPNLIELHPTCKLLLTVLLETDSKRRFSCRAARGLCLRALIQMREDGLADIERR